MRLFFTHDVVFTKAAGLCILIAIAAVSQSARAQVVVPNLLAATEGNTNQAALVSSGARTYQTQIAASQLIGFTTGSQIGGLSFRLDNSNVVGPGANLTFASYQVTLSQAANSIGSFSSTFANNIGANAATVYNSSLTFTVASFSTGASGTTPNAFGPTVFFSVPYTYQGGDLVITIRHGGESTGQLPSLDATNSAAQGYGTAVVGQFSTAGQNAVTATSQGTAPVVRLNAAAPEPGTLVLFAMGLVSGAGTLGVARRRRRSLP